MKTDSKTPKSCVSNSPNIVCKEIKAEFIRRGLKYKDAIQILQAYEIAASEVEISQALTGVSKPKLSEIRKILALHLGIGEGEEKMRSEEMNIGENVKRLREAKNLTKTALAAEVGVTYSMICQIERGTKTLSLPLALNIADVLGCTIAELAGASAKEVRSNDRF